MPRPRARQEAQYEEDSLLVASLPKPLEKKKAWEPPKLLPDPEPEPKVVYIVPFVSIMVPREVETQLFDLFIEDLNERGKDLELNFVILKEGLENVAPEWLWAAKPSPKPVSFSNWPCAAPAAAKAPVQSWF